VPEVLARESSKPWSSESGDFQGFLLTYNSKEEAAEAFQRELLLSKEGNNVNANLKKVHVVGGDLTLPETRDRYTFNCFDNEFDATNDELVLLVHNAGQYEVRYVEATSDDAERLKSASGKNFGNNGSRF
jgi:hypothetical protein